MEAVVQLSIHVELRDKSLKEIENILQEHLNVVCYDIEQDENYVYVSYNINRVTEV